MFGLFRKHATAMNNTPARKSSYRPRLEGLEARTVLSASSAAIHAVTDAQGHSAVFDIQQQAYKTLYMHDAAHGIRQVGAAGNVDSFSAGLDANGKADVFVKDLSGNLTQYTESATVGGELTAHVLGGVKSFAAVHGGRAYAIFQDNTLHKWNGASWSLVPGVGTVKSLDAVTDKSGNDAVFVIKSNNTFGELYHGVYTQLAGSVNRTIHIPPLHLPGGRTIPGRNITINLPTVSDFSAGTASNGNADVFAKVNGNFQRNTAGTAAGWTTLASAAAVRSFSAVNFGTVDFIGSDGHLKKFDANGTLHVLDSAHTYLSVSGAASNDVFGVRADHNVWERSAGGVFNVIDGSGLVQQ